MHVSNAERSPSGMNSRRPSALVRYIAWLVGTTLTLASVVGCSAAPRSNVESQRSTTSGAASDEANEISAFIDPNSKVRISRAADLDGDGDLDLVAVIAKKDAAPSDVPRTLLLLKRTADGRLERAVENPNAVLAEDRGGTMSDPLQDLTARRGGFTLNLEGGSRELWSHQYSFEYLSDRDTWLLTEFKENVLDRHDGKNVQRTLRPSDFGEVTAADFDPDALATD